MSTTALETAGQATSVYVDLSLVPTWGWIVCILAVIVSYFIGNISPAILIGKAHGINIKKEGSGNAGTTNVLRVLGKKAAVGTLVIDIMKGVVAVWIGYGASMFAFGPVVSALMTEAMATQGATEGFTEYVIPYRILMMACGLAVFCGHIWPLAFGFKGGKGVATAFGVLVAFKPLLGITALIIVLAAVAITRKVSMGSIVGAVTLPPIAYFLFPEGDYSNIYLGWTVLMAIIVIIKHRTNIVRLIKGEESNISFKSKKEEK